MKATAAMPADSTPKTPSKKTFLNINAAESSFLFSFLAVNVVLVFVVVVALVLVHVHVHVVVLSLRSILPANYTILCRFTFIISNLFPFFILVVWCLKNL